MLIRNSAICFIKAIIFYNDGTISNSEEYLLELAKTRVEFAVSKYKQLKIRGLLLTAISS